MIGAIIGAISAHNAGGNVWAGAAVGAALGYFGAGLANMAISAMGIGAEIGIGATAASSWGGSLITPLEGALITGTEFAIGGFAAGAASGYAGGKGSVGDIFTQAGIGSAIGFGTGFAVGYSYTAGWQSILHGADTQRINKEVARQTRIHTEIYGRLRVSSQKPQTENDTGHALKRRTDKRRKSLLRQSK